MVFKVTQIIVVGILTSAIIGSSIKSIPLKSDEQKAVYLTFTLNEIFDDSLPVTLHYFDRMFSANDSIFIQEFEREFLLILNDTQTQYYHDLSGVTEKKEFINYYWRVNNPNPVLDQNDLLLGHIRRCAYARANYSTGDPKNIDDRGRYYIKYGEPQARFVDPGGMRRIALFTPGIYERIKRYYGFKGAPPKNYTTPANETWSYENISANFVVHFVSGVRGFREIDSLSDILTSRKLANMAWQWSDLIKQRAPISPTLSEVSAEITAFEDQILLDALSRNTSGERVSKGAADDKMIQYLKKGEEPIENGRSRIPTIFYKPIHAENQIPFSHRIAQFRGADNHSRVEIFFLSPLVNNFLPDEDNKMLDTVSVEFSAMLRNRFHNPIAREQISAFAIVNRFEKETLENAVGMLILEAKPQSSDLTMQIRNLRKSQTGFSRLNMDVRDFNSSTLMISDIQLYWQIENENLMDNLPSIEKQGLILSPYPFQKIRKSETVFCYFEIYNLISSGVRDEYELTYKITSQDDKKGLFSKLTRLLKGREEISISLQQEQIVRGDFVEELIGLDMSNLGNGKHLLEIQVADKADSSFSVKAVSLIDIVN